MRYSIPKEIIEKYNHKDSFELYSNYQLILLVYCMESPIENTSDAIQYIQCNLIAWYFQINKETQKKVYNTYQQNGEIDDFDCYESYSTEKELFDDFTEILILFKNLIPTPNYFSSLEDFFYKRDEIKDKLMEFKDNAINFSKCSLLKELEKYKINEEQSN